MVLEVTQYKMALSTLVGSFDNTALHINPAALFRYKIVVVIRE